MHHTNYYEGNMSLQEPVGSEKSDLLSDIYINLMLSYLLQARARSCQAALLTHDMVSR